MTRTGWSDPLTPAADSQWDSYPAMCDLMPWYSPGVFPVRTWICAPNAEILRRRWHTLLAETDTTTQADLFRKGRDASMSKAKEPLPGADTHHASSAALRLDTVTQPQPVRFGYRSFDRQWILPDSRLMEMPRRDLWAARVPGQIFAVEQHSMEISDGPGIVFSAVIPDFHYFNNRGGRALPHLHPDGEANLAPGLTKSLTKALGRDVTSDDVLAYVAAVVAHPAYTQTYAEELSTPGIRVPITRNPELWSAGVALGEQVIWLHTYGEVGHGSGRPHDNVRFPRGDSRQPLCAKPITSMPETLSYDEGSNAIVIGDGQFSPVRPEVWNYTVGGRNVIGSWFNYRKRDPGGRRPSLLDRIYPVAWDPEWTIEAIDLLTVLTRLVEIEPAQAELLASVLDGELLSMDDLRAAGTAWPVTPKDRKPHHSYKSLGPSGPQSGTVTLDM